MKMKFIYALIFSIIVGNSFANAFSIKCDIGETGDMMTVSYLPFAVQVINSGGGVTHLADAKLCAGRALQNCRYTTLPNHKKLSVRCLDSSGHTIHQTFSYLEDGNLAYFTCNDLDSSEIFYSNFDLHRCRIH